MNKKSFGEYSPGDLVTIIRAPDQNIQFMSKLIGKIGLVLNHLSEKDGIYSSRNMYTVLVEGKNIHLHALDMSILSAVEKNKCEEV